MLVRSLVVMLAFVLLLVPSSTSAQEVQGVVVSAGTGSPVGGARISISMESFEAPDLVDLTRLDGTFHFSLPRAGLVRIHVEQFGFHGWSSEVIEIESGELHTVEVELVPEAIEIEGIEAGVTARGDEWGRRQFERRRAEGDSRATFLDPVHIALTDARHPIDFFRQAQGIIVEHDDRIRPLVGRCVLVYLDHIRLPIASFFTTPPLLAFGGVNDLGHIVSQRDIRAIEIYPHRATIPRELRNNYRRTSCALMQIWTSIGW